MPKNKKFLKEKFSFYLSAEKRTNDKVFVLLPIIATPRKQHTCAILNIKVHKHILIACLSYILPLLSCPSLDFAGATFFPFITHLHYILHLVHDSFTSTVYSFILFFITCLMEVLNSLRKLFNYSNTATKNLFFLSFSSS